MGSVLIEAIEDWSEGVVTSARPDELPKNAASRGWNSAFKSLAPGKTVIGTRKGLSTMNATAITANAPIIGQYHFQPRNTATGVLESIHLLLTSTGRLERLASGTLTNLSTSFDATDALFPDFETANNLCFISNGTDSFKVTPTPAVQIFGIAAPSAPTAVAFGAGVMTGDYEVALTYYNSTTGHESSLSPATTVTLAAQQLRVTIPNAADAQVDYVRIHIRLGTLSAYFFRVVSGTGYNSTHGGWIDNYGTVDLNLSDSDLTNLIILSPDEDENDPPPTDLRFLCWHQTRMFGSNGKTLRYTKLGLPESWDPDLEEPINEDDGQTVTGLHTVGGVLLIFKTRSVYGLFGDDPNSWYLRQLDADTGCTSHRSILTIEGKTYWWSLRGPMQLGGDGTGDAPIAIGHELLAPTIAPDALAYGEFDSVCAAADFVNQRVLFAVASFGSTVNDTILPFSYRLSRWEASKWDPLNVASFGQLIDSTGITFVSLGSYQGQAFQMDSGTNDGVPSGTTTGTFTASGTSVTVLTDGAATFNTTGGALRERKVTLVDPNGAWIGRGTIASNTATALTLSAAISGLTNGTIYTYYIGGPDFQWDVRWSDFDMPFHKKRFEYLWLQGLAATSTTLHVDLAFDWNPNYGQSRTVSMAGTSTTWDATVWTHASYTTSLVKHHRVRVGRTGRVWKARLRLHIPDKPVTIVKVGAQAEQMTTKS